MKLGKAALMVVILIGALVSDLVLARGGGHSGSGRSGGHHSSSHHSGGHRSGIHHSGTNRHFSGSRGFVGAFVVAPGFWPWWDYPSYLPVAMTSPQPVQYIEKSEEEAQSAGDWFYCAGAKAYYPYVSECPGGWQRVAPQPPAE